MLYGMSAIALTAVFLGLAGQVALNQETDQAKMQPERRLFFFSIVYLFALFGALVIDRFVA
jgi:protoheme IX farnesyltransferase